MLNQIDTNNRILVSTQLERISASEVVKMVLLSMGMGDLTKNLTITTA